MSAIGILRGIRVIGFTQYLLGPFAVQYLGDLGADVIKVEAPGGSWERRWSGSNTYVNGVSMFFLMSNRNCRSITLNLKSEEGVQIAKRIIETADVVVENLRPGVLEKYGLGYSDVSPSNPRLVYASASGYGRNSSNRGLAGQDLLLQAISGLASVTGCDNQPPTPAGAPVVDQHGATLLALAIMAALYHRERTGKGQQVEVTMLEAAMELQAEPIAYYLNGGSVRRPREHLASSFHPAPYGIYETLDGYIALALAPLKVLAEEVGAISDLGPYLDPEQAFADRDTIRNLLGPYLKGRGTMEWVTVLRSAGLWCAPVNDYESLLSDPCTKELHPVMEMTQAEAGVVRTLRTPLHFSTGESAVRRAPPRVGEHTADVLGEVGYLAEDIERLRSAGAI